MTTVNTLLAVGADSKLARRVPCCSCFALTFRKKNKNLERTHEAYIYRYEAAARPPLTPDPKTPRVDKRQKTHPKTGKQPNLARHDICPETVHEPLVSRGRAVECIKRIDGTKERPSRDSRPADPPRCGMMDSSESFEPTQGWVPPAPCPASSHNYDEYLAARKEYPNGIGAAVPFEDLLEINVTSSAQPCKTYGLHPVSAQGPPARRLFGTCGKLVVPGRILPQAPPFGALCGSDGRAPLRWRLCEVP
jgi:hypothetical protein